MRSGWLFMRFDPVAFYGESALRMLPTGFRTRATILPSLPYPRAFASPRQQATLTATESGDPWSLGRCLVAGGKVLGRKPNGLATHRRYLVRL